MRFCVRIMVCAVVVAVLAAMLMMVGCSSDDDAKLFLNASERPSWGPAGKVALTAWGGNEIRYIYSVQQGGGGLTLLTGSDKSDDFGHEGGWHPAYRPDDGSIIAFAGRRSQSPREGIYRMDATAGDRNAAAALITSPQLSGADGQPSWKPDSSGLVFSTTEFTGTMDLATVAADGSGRERVPLDPAAFDWDNADEMWPAYTPNGKQIVFECRRRGDNQSDIWIHDVESGQTTNLTASNFDDGAPAVQPVVAEGAAAIILFHSNRNGAKYDLWAMDLDGGNPRPVTQTNRSDGFPVWSPDGTRVAFVRDREVWTMKWTDTEADRDYIRLTRRFR